MPSSHGVPSLWSTPPWQRDARRDVAQRVPDADQRRQRLVVGRRCRPRLRQRGVVRGKVADLAVRQVRGERLHERARALAALVVVHLLDDDLRELAREVRRIGDAHALGAVAHRAVQRERCAATDRVVVDRRAPSRRSSTTFGRRRTGPRAGLPSAQLAGTPAARQMLAHRPCAVKSPCTEGSHDEADQHRRARSARSATRGSSGDPTDCPTQAAMRLHHRLPIGTTGTHASFGAASCAIGVRS